MLIARPSPHKVASRTASRITSAASASSPRQAVSRSAGYAIGE